MSSSEIKAPFLRKEKIEAKAVNLVEGYYQVLINQIQPPIDVEEIIETYLKIGFDFNDLKEREGQSNIDGAIYFEENLIVIDSRLDPTEEPSKEGRYRYTCGHEIGHYILHQDVKTYKDPDQLSLLPAKFEPFSLCRVNENTYQARTEEDWIEWQADYFSAVFLMPTKLVVSDFNDYWGERMPQSEFELYHFVREMSNRYGVSKTAMSRRLKDLKLLDQKMPLFSGVSTV